MLYGPKSRSRIKCCEPRTAHRTLRNPGYLSLVNIFTSPCTFRNRRIREYFYGTSLSPLTPVTLTVRSDSLTVYRIGKTMPVAMTSLCDMIFILSFLAMLERSPVPYSGGGPRAPNSTLPIGQSSVADPLRLTHVPAGSELIQCLLAVTHAPSEDMILSTNVAGFVLIKDIDSARGTVTYLSPCPGTLPGHPYLVTGSIRSSVD